MDAYRDFVRKSLVFREGAERALAPIDGWSVEPLAQYMRADLADLGDQPDESRLLELEEHDAPSALGVAYVLEGSALGARLLARRAAELGLGAAHGARHLAAQTGDPGRWKAFLAKLDAIAEADHDRALAGAVSTFDFALSIYAADTP